MLVKRVATMEEEANILKTPSHPKFAIMLCEMSIEEAYQKNQITKYFECLAGLNQDTMYHTFESRIVANEAVPKAEYTRP